MIYFHVNIQIILVILHGCSGSKIFNSRGFSNSHEVVGQDQKIFFLMIHLKKFHKTQLLLEIIYTYVSINRFL